MGVGDRKRPGPEPEPLSLWWFVLGFVALASVAVIVGAAYRFHRRGVSLSPPSAGREQRLRPAAQVALAPLADGVPLIERPGNDGDGYPRTYVDRVALRGLLGRGKFVELSRSIEQFQRDFELDHHKEYFVSDAADAFASAEAEIEPQLEAWVAATPSSFAPYLARGTHRVARAYEQRGAEFAQKTGHDEFRAMADEFAKALPDFEHALKLAPRAVAALRGELKIAMASSRTEAELASLARRVDAACPACFQPRVMLQYALEPRWGGSYAAMERAARSANPTLNRKLGQLPGYADRDRAQVAAHEDDYPRALLLIERACAVGDNPDFLADKARYLSHQKDEQGALTALSLALELRPQRPDLLFARADVYLRGKVRDPEAAYRDLMLGLHIEPTDSAARRTLPYVAGALGQLASEAQARGDLRLALRALDEAFDLTPNQPLENRRVAVLTLGFHGTEQEVDALTRAAEAAPNGLYEHQRLDYALSTLQRWDAIVAMWTRFIEANPSEGRAYYERSGTYSHVPGMAAAAKADLLRACDLGVSPACVLAKRQ